MLLQNSRSKHFAKSKVRDRRRVNKVILSHVRRISVQLLNTIFGNFFVYGLVGVLNRLIGYFTGERPLQGAFVFYAPNDYYLNTMIYSWYKPFVRWNAGLGQLILQNGKGIMSFGLSANEKDFYNSDNKGNMQYMVRRMEKIAYLLGAQQLTFAGIIPNVLQRYNIERKNSVEKKNTVNAVVKSVYRTIEQEELDKDVPVVILGGAGFIGSGICQKLNKLSYPGQIFSVDIKNGDRKVIPLELTGKSIILLNVSKKHAILDYISQMWDGVIVVNEVFPEPSSYEIAKMKKHNVKCYHITGVAGRSLPSFGGAYRGGIPCCASLGLEDNNYEVLMKLL